MSQHLILSCCKHMRVLLWSLCCGALRLSTQLAPNLPCLCWHAPLQCLPAAAPSQSGARPPTQASLCHSRSRQPLHHSQQLAQPTWTSLAWRTSSGAGESTRWGEGLALNGKLPGGGTQGQVRAWSWLVHGVHAALHNAHFASHMPRVFAFARLSEVVAGLQDMYDAAMRGVAVATAASAGLQVCVLGGPRGRGRWAGTAQRAGRMGRWRWAWNLQSGCTFVPDLEHVP